MPTVNTYEPTELEALETAHEAVLYCIQLATDDWKVTPAHVTYHRRLCDSAYWLRTRLGELRQG